MRAEFMGAIAFGISIVAVEAAALTPYSRDGQLSAQQVTVLEHLAWPQAYRDMIGTFGYPRYRANCCDWYLTPAGVYVVIHYDSMSQNALATGYHWKHFPIADSAERSPRYGADGSITAEQLRTLQHLAWPQRRADMIGTFGYPRHYSDQADYYAYGDRWVVVWYRETLAMSYSTQENL
ncbi:hypothetical protein [Sphaerothrix gracilis]|uniref:hypothetical protein n=1 Tax=Sphaerothrix gracilis TaxID=3151835 RepID=UPI0031FD834A